MYIVLPDPHALNAYSLVSSKKESLQKILKCVHKTKKKDLAQIIQKREFEC